jgi:hypothetical protein
METLPDSDTDAENDINIVLRAPRERKSLESSDLFPTKVLRGREVSRQERFADV